MSFTRDWSESNPVDHLKFKNAPGEVRNVRTDLAERLNAILYGFVAGEAYAGIKKGRFVTLGTGAPSAPPGTGNQAAFDLYARSNGTGTNVELYGMYRSANEIQFSLNGKIPLDISARLANSGWLIARNYANNADVNILKVNTGNGVEFASHPYGPDTGPSSALQYAPKGYVDAKVGAIQGTSLGNWVDKSSSYGAQQATTDGFVTVIANTNGNTGGFAGYTDDNSNPTTLRQYIYRSPQSSGEIFSFMFPVKKNHYWKVVFNTWTVNAVYWIPLGT